MYTVYSEHLVAPTFDIVGVVDDEVSVPDHRQVHWQVTDVIPLVGVLQNKATTSRLAFTENSVFLTAVI